MLALAQIHIFIAMQNYMVIVTFSPFSAARQEYIKWDKVFKSGLSEFFKGCIPQNLHSPLLNTLSQIILIWNTGC